MKIGGIIPVKKFDDSKNRLSAFFTLEEKKELVKCMLFDVCDVLVRSSYINEIVIVTSENEISQYENYEQIIRLEENHNSGVNNAVEIGNKYFIKRGFDATIVIPGDIPLINNQVLEKVFEYTNENQVIITPSIREDGTNLLFRSPPDIMQTSYDNNSYSSHLEMINDNNLQYSVYLEDAIRLDLDEPSDIDIINSKLSDSRTKDILKKIIKH
ncbi:MAG: 2-phospho-L-lactate guanylyltransferase [Thaumarchaeota archaeon]|nr:2-phospho-L-lactate guanylyltransferase [Nitrososphaerota archaeon]|tara:strand:- start:1590 stop:2228 length:639 start_codon:yes stop_codon:yes gene_type:complete